jgi:uncharacterized phage protein gp47/JayE
VSALGDFIREAYAPGDTLYVSQIDNTISDVAGEISHKLVQPSQDMPTSKVQVAMLGDVTFPLGGVNG